MRRTSRRSSPRAPPAPSTTRGWLISATCSRGAPFTRTSPRTSSTSWCSPTELSSRSKDGSTPRRQHTQASTMLATDFFHVELLRDSAKSQQLVHLREARHPLAVPVHRHHLRS